MLYFGQSSSWDSIPRQGLLKCAMADDYFRQYGLLAIFSALAVGVPTGMLLMSWMLSMVNIRPSLPNPIKQSIYECGFETLTGRWSHFNFRYYIFALIFVIFDVEVVFLYPWAVVYRELGMLGLVEMSVFLGVLLVGFVYAWDNKALEWK